VAAWARTRLRALLDGDADAAAVLALAAEHCSLPGPSFTLHPIADQDWVRLTQAQFEPIRVGPRLMIAPSWHLEAVRPHVEGAQLIMLDPGLAFGTGSHPTTRMCLEWLDTHLEPGQSVIDYGCGSGILAIAAARLGAQPVSAIDIDPQALVSTRDNALANGVTLQIMAAESARPDPAAVVVANILANPLRLLAPLLSSLVRPGGSLVLAGLLERQADELRALYPQIALEVYARREGWACLAGVRR
jgi:ribosomal protein L11 methyltransferase